MNKANSLEKIANEANEKAEKMEDKQRSFLKKLNEKVLLPKEDRVHRIEYKHPFILTRSELCVYCSPSPVSSLPSQLV